MKDIANFIMNDFNYQQSIRNSVRSVITHVEDDSLNEITSNQELDYGIVPKE